MSARHFASEEVDSVEVLMKHSPGMLSSLREKIGGGGVKIQYLCASASVSDKT